MAEENKPDEELKLKELEDGSVAVGDEPPPEPKNEESDDDHDEQDEKLVASSDDEEHTDDDSEEERAAKTERNRQRRLEGKQKRKEAMESLKRELAARDRIINDLNSRIAVVERKSSGSEMAQLQKVETDAVQAYNYFKQQHSLAVEQANGAAATDAAEKMMQARQAAEHYGRIKQQMGKKEQTPQPLDPRLVNHAEKWMTQNKWYDPSGKDQDSAVTLTIDNRLAAEGWDPTTPEYWDELQSRVKQYLPHRAKSSYNNSQGNGNRRSPPPVAGSSRESSGATQTTYKLSAERVQALKDAGMWEDPKARSEAIKSFQAYDKGARA